MSKHLDIARCDYALPYQRCDLQAGHSGECSSARAIDWQGPTKSGAMLSDVSLEQARAIFSARSAGYLSDTKVGMCGPGSPFDKQAARSGWTVCVWGPTDSVERATGSEVQA
jgi:hypothetical protein